MVRLNEVKYIFMECRFGYQEDFRFQEMSLKLVSWGQPHFLAALRVDNKRNLIRIAACDLQ